MFISYRTSSICSLPGIEHFLKTGVITEYPAQLTGALELVDRVTLVERMLESETFKDSLILKKSIGSEEYGLNIMADERFGYILFNRPDGDFLYLRIDDPSIIAILRDFLTISLNPGCTAMKKHSRS